MLEPSRFVVRERARPFRRVRAFDILDDTGNAIGTATETIGPLARCLRQITHKRVLPSRVEVRENPDDALVFTIRRTRYVAESRVEVRDALGELVGYFPSQSSPFGGGFYVYTCDDQLFAELTGDFVNSEYRVTAADEEQVLGRVTRQWPGLARKPFISADAYAVELNDTLAGQPIAKMLVLAAALTVDIFVQSEST